MSLEQTLERTNSLLEQLLTVLQSGLAAEAELGKPERKPRTSKKVEAPAAPAGTVFWSIPKYNSVFAQEPGMAEPTIEGAVKITQEEYDAKKAEQRLTTDQVLAKQREASQAATTTSAPSATTSAPTPPTAEVAAVAAPAPSTTEGSSTTRSAAASGASPVTFPQVLEAAKKLNSSSQPGHGREAVMGILRKLLPDDPQPTVTKLDGKVDLAAALAEFQAPFAAAQAEFDPLA